LKLSLSTKAIARTIDDEAVVLDFGSDMYYGLNAAGAWIWERLAQGGPVALETLLTDLVAEFDVDRQTAERDLNEFVSTLRSKDLVDVHD
jgi:hypothetical protein